MRTKVILKNGYTFTGIIESETQTKLIINETKLGTGTQISKDSIMLRSDSDE